MNCGDSHQEHTIAEETGFRKLLRFSKHFVHTFLKIIVLAICSASTAIGRDGLQRSSGRHAALAQHLVWSPPETTEEGESE